MEERDGERRCAMAGWLVNSPLSPLVPRRERGTDKNWGKIRTTAAAG